MNDHRNDDETSVERYLRGGGLEIKRLRAELAAKDARIAALTVVLNRLANATRFTSDQTLRAVHKVTTEVLGNAYEPFDVKMP